MLLTYKEKLKSEAPFSVLPGDQYLELLKKNEGAIYQGIFGVYLARKVIVDGQEMYQIYIDIDAAPGLEGHEEIASAIQFAHLTVKTFESLGVADHFRFIATGGTGFRVLANFLMNRPAYFAFLDWMRVEMPHIHDRKPSLEIDFPHQVFGYKGDDLHNDKALTDSHSTVIDKNLLSQGVFTVDDYLQVTEGKPDPREIFSFVEWLLDGTIISDLNVLGVFGKRIAEYQQISNDFHVNPFSFLQIRRKNEPIGLQQIHQMLADKGILSKIESRGKQAISFRGLPCPLCGKTTSNARAYPPSYTLKCWNSNCEASTGTGVPLHRWSGIQNSGGCYHSKKNGYDLTPPKQCVDLGVARNLIAQELNNLDNSLLVLTPGVGKTYAALLVISNNNKDKVIIYAAFNRALQKEAYDKCCELAGHSNGFHLIQSRNEKTCRRAGEIKDITLRGFSPTEILCDSCQYREKDCEYYNQRRNIGPGVYFVTLHMLQYLEKRFPKPDLIILDENLKGGLLLEDSCTELQIKSLLKIVKGNDAALIMHILNIFQKLSVQLVENNWRDTIFNGRKLTGTDETTIIDLLSKWTGRSEDEIITNLKSLSKNLNEKSSKHLYLKGIDINGIAWINGLCSRDALSFVQISYTGEISYNTKRITQLGYHESPIKILDATGDASAIEPLVGRKLKTVRADVGWKSNRVHIKKSLSRKDMALATEKDLKKLLTEMLSKTQAQKIMVITYMKHEIQVLKILEAIAPTRDFMSFHFIGPRGINSYQSCEAVLVIGLPYSNLNSAAQDACILFSNKKDVEKRTDWAEANMQWEFVQGIHRIRPILKTSTTVDIILAANSWPTSLPEPTVVIDQSQNANWKELAIKRLEPFVEKYGFLNQDIGFLANVYIKSKIPIAQRFRENLSKLLDDNLNCSSRQLSQLCTSLFSLEGKNCSFGYNCLDLQSKSGLPEDEKLKLIYVIYNNIYYNLLVRKRANSLLNDQTKKDKKDTTYEEIILSNTTQWAGLLIDFKEKNPHFEAFKIKLPHARGNLVDGVGNPERVKDFYRQLNDLGIVGKTNIDSYQLVGQSACSTNPIPEGFTTVYIPANEDLAFVGWGSEFAQISLTDNPSQLRIFFEDVVTELQHKIITNNGKRVAKIFLSSGLPACEIIDVVIAEKLLANGEVDYQVLDLKKVFKRHDFHEGLERSLVVHRLVEVWNNQAALIKSGGLEKIFSIESQVIWVTAKIEAAGIGIDVDALLQLSYDLAEKLNDLVADVEGMLPEGVELKDDDMIKEYLNSTYNLHLAKIDEDSIKTIPNLLAKFIAINRFGYGRITGALRNIETYMSLTGLDDRVRDKVNQLGAQTGRFSRSLQNVRRSGPIRSLFRAKKGYKFIVADYSQHEARIIAGLSGDQAAINLFKEKKDIYLETATLVTKVGGDARRYRELGKKIVLGLNNGQFPSAISDELAREGLYYELEEVQEFVRLYFNRFPGIKRWREETLLSALENGNISTKLGRSRKLSDADKENSICSHPVQGTGAEGFKMSLVDLDRQLVGRDAQIVHILHDEIIVEVREDIAGDVAVTVKECMERAFTEIFPEVRFVVEPEIRDSWGVSIQKPF